jgi:hypothetical protein
MTAPRPRIATLQHVADAAGVHRSTASRALDPATSGLISSAVVARVADAASRLGYRRDLLAAGLRNSRSRLVGVLVPDMANPVFAPILGGIEAALAEAGYATLVANARPGDLGSLDLIDELVGRRAEGVILATARANDPVLARCLELGLPVVLVNRADPEGRLPAWDWRCAIWSGSVTARSRISRGRAMSPRGVCGRRGSATPWLKPDWTRNEWSRRPRIAVMPGRRRHRPY